MSHPAGPSRSNRRLTARTACHLVVRYRSGKEWHPATALDLSNLGCRLRLGQDLPRGALLTVRLESAAFRGQPALEVEVPSSVIWCRLEGLSYQAGLNFAEVPPALQQILGALG